MTEVNIIWNSSRVSKLVAWAAQECEGLDPIAVSRLVDGYIVMRDIAERHGFDITDEDIRIVRATVAIESKSASNELVGALLFNYHNGTLGLDKLQPWAQEARRTK